MSDPPRTKGYLLLIDSSKPDGYLEGKVWLRTIIEQLNLEKLPELWNVY